MTSNQRIALALLWLALLTLAGWLLGSRMELTGDPPRLSTRRAREFKAARAASHWPVSAIGVHERWKPRPRLAIVEALT